MNRFISIILLTLLTVASDGSNTEDQIHIKNLNLTFDDSQGAGNAELIKVPLFHRNIHEKQCLFDFAKEYGVINLNLANEKYIIKNQKILKDYQSLLVNNLNLNLKDDEIYLQYDKLITTTAKQKTIQFRNLELICFSNQKKWPYTDLSKESIITICSNNAELKIRSIKESRLDSGPSFSLVSFISSLFLNEDEIQIHSVLSNIENLKLTITNHYFILKGHVTLNDTKRRIKITGQAHYSNLEKQLKLKIFSAKAGIISIKKIIFRRLKQQRSPNIIVRYPYIIIKNI